MADTFGGISLPVDVPATGDAVGDHALKVVGDYISAVLNAYGTTAWQTVLQNKPACGAVYLHDPKRFDFIDTYLPAIFIWRSKDVPGQAIEYRADDYLEDGSEWTVMYVYPPAQQAFQVKRQTFDNAIGKIVGLLIEKYRDPSYVADGDADITAAAIPTAPTSIKLQVATSASPQAYSGAALDGTIGQGAILPRRPITVTLGGSPAAFVNGSAIVVAGLDVVGQPITNVLTIDTSAIPGTLAGGNDLSAVTSLSVAAQSGTGGTISFGTGSRSGLGSNYLAQAGLEGLRVKGWKSSLLPIPMSPDQTRTYWAVEMTLEAIELFEPDLTLSTAPNTGTTQSFVRDDGSLIEQAEYLAP